MDEKKILAGSYVPVEKFNEQTTTLMHQLLFAGNLALILKNGDLIKNDGTRK